MFVMITHLNLPVGMIDHLSGSSKRQQAVVSHQIHSMYNLYVLHAVGSSCQSARRPAEQALLLHNARQGLLPSGILS